MTDEDTTIRIERILASLRSKGLRAATLEDDKGPMVGVQIRGLAYVWSHIPSNPELDEDFTETLIARRALRLKLYPS
jgi:hypothetical protein